MNTEVVHKLSFSTLPQKFFKISLGVSLSFLMGIGGYAAMDSYVISKEKSFKIEVDTRNKSSQKAFSFADYDIEAPDECKKITVFCHEKTVITSHIYKEWEIIPVPSIGDKNLSPQGFSEFYPDLPEDEIIHNWSDPSKKWIVQRILYERGLLPVFPTGKIGFLTEEAIAKLQYYKGIEEVDEKKGVVVIGPKTIRELNKLKARMEAPEFVSRSPLPVIPFEDFAPFAQKRLVQIDEELQRRVYVPEKQEIKIPQGGIVKSKTPGNQIHFEGEVLLKINNN